MIVVFKVKVFTVEIVAQPGMKKNRTFGNYSLPARNVTMRNGGSTGLQIFITHHGVRSLKKDLNCISNKLFLLLLLLLM